MAIMVGNYYFDGDDRYTEKFNSERVFNSKESMVEYFSKTENKYILSEYKDRDPSLEENQEEEYKRMKKPMTVKEKEVELNKLTFINTSLEEIFNVLGQIPKGTVIYKGHFGGKSLLAGDRNWKKRLLYAERLPELESWLHMNDISMALFTNSVYAGGKFGIKPLGIKKLFYKEVELV